MARTVNPVSQARQRSRILTAAAREFAAQGYDGTSTAMICRRAGIGSGTLFHYFPSKQDILHALFADDLPVIQEVVQRAAATPDPDTALDLLVHHLIGELADPLSPGLAATAVLRASQDQKLAAILAKLDAVVQGGLTDQLRIIERQHPDRLVFGVDRTSRWIRGLIDAAHLDLIDQSRPGTVEELRKIIDWLIGR